MMGPARTPPVIRFWPKVDVRVDGCWLWTACLNRDGYGRFGLTAGPVLAHRFAYELVNGPIPEGLQLDHLCRVRACVRPDHLEPVTLIENQRRAPATFISLNEAKTHCPSGHPYDERNTYRYGGARQCITCRRERTHEWYQRTRSA